MLKVNNLKVNYGWVEAVKGATFEVNQGEIVTLIGSNGAGKTTTLNALMGTLKYKGDVYFLGDKWDSDISPASRMKKGLVLVPEGRGIFGNLSVLENLELGAYHNRSNLFDGLEKVFGLFPKLKERLDQKAGTLSGGEQQMLALGRALMANPKCLMLDEPSMGLAPKIVQEMFQLIVELRSQGITIVLVEQNAYSALKIADRAYILEAGNLVQQGAAQDLIKDPSVIQSYLGGRH